MKNKIKKFQINILLGIIYKGLNLV